MKAVGFSIDSDFDCVDGIAYLPNQLYQEMRSVYQGLNGNDIEFIWELESGHEQIYEKLLSYAALCICMSHAKYDNRNYEWGAYFSFDYFDFEPQPIQLDVELYAKSLFYSQWRIESYIEDEVIRQNPERRKYIRRITKVHNEVYSKSYEEWAEQSFTSEEYLIEQYRREIDERIKRHDITLPVLEEYAKKFQSLSLSHRGLLVLLRKLDLTYENKRPYRNSRLKSFVSEYGSKTEVYKEPPSKSIRAISTPMGGQNKRR